MVEGKGEKEKDIPWTRDGSFKDGFDGVHVMSCAQCAMGFIPDAEDPADDAVVVVSSSAE